ncbi:MAG TPA: 2-dehydropantoate 2-reductase [Chthoniobacterales bacterium]|jgi:2-dehydropantoate 2-reductase|nr:2-dehydropantoate 2-reductase [Chthoniobacterales bacterium]
MPLRIAIVGSGAVGTYYGAKLAHAGSDVHFLVRGDLTEVRRNGIFVRGKGENFRVVKVNCYNSTTEIGLCDLVIVAVKATSNSDLVDLVPPLLHEQTMILTLQNGLGNDEFVAKYFSADRVLGGLCFIAVDRHSETEVERYDYGLVILGEFGRPAQPRTHAVAAEFTRAGVKCSVRDDVALERWRKLIWNIPFNGLSILAGGVDTAAIVGDKNLRQITLALMDEVIVAANKCGHALPTDAWREHIKRTETMSGYKPSTLKDWEKGQPLEIEAIWGEPLRRAVAAGAQMPRTEMIYALLKKLDQARRSR